MIARRGIVHHLLASAALAAGCGAAAAQTPGSPAPGTAATATPSPPSTPLAGGTATAMSPAPGGEPFGEIVVTATRQEQVLSKVPISLSAFNQQALDLKGAKSLADIVRFTPGITFETGSNEVSIRGISSNAGAGTTGIYIDDTPIQIRNLGFNSDDSLPAIFDLDRVEILRGPQGTLFGAGSEGGTIRYITPQPGLDRYTGYARSEISSTAHGGLSYEAGAAVGGPIVKDVLGFRISAFHRRDSGWIDKTDNDGNITNRNTNHDEVTVLRGALTWQPADGLKITPVVQYQQRTVADDDFYVEAISNAGKGVFKDSSPSYRRNPDRFVLPSLKLDYDLGGIRVISNTSYFSRRNTSGYDGTFYDLSYYQGLLASGPGDGEPPFPGAGQYPLLTTTGVNPVVDYYRSPSVVTNRQRIFTQEVRAQSTDPNAKLTWVAGVFYQKQRQLSREELVDPLADQLFGQLFGESIADYFGQPLYAGPAGIDSYINQSVSHEKQIAVFGDATFHFNDRLSLTAGGRYAELTYRFVNFADGSQNGGRSDASGKSKNRPFTPKVNVSYQIDRDNLLYATYAKGFRPAGANALIPPGVCDELPDGGGTVQYKPDTVKSFEIGSKNKFLDRKLSVAASIYNIDWKGIQQYVFLPSCAIQFIDNLGKARARGFDLQLTATPIAGITIDAAVGYTDTHYVTDASSAQVGLAAGKGDAIGGSPWTVSVGAQYDFPAFGRQGYVRGDYQYASRLNRRTPQQDPDTVNFDPALIPSAATTNVSLRAGALVNGANVSLFVDNLLDTTPLIERTHQDSDTILFTNRTWRPRTVGLTASYKM